MIDRFSRFFFHHAMGQNAMKETKEGEVSGSFIREWTWGVDFTDFTIQTPTFHVKEFFMGMGWVLVASRRSSAHDLMDFEPNVLNLYLKLMKYFHKDIVYFLVRIAFLVFSKIKELQLPKLFLCSLLELKDVMIKFFIIWLTRPWKVIILTLNVVEWLGKILNIQ